MVFTHVGDDVRVGDRPGGRAWWSPTQKSRLEVMCTFVGDDVPVSDRPGGRSWWAPTQRSLLHVIFEYVGTTFVSATDQGHVLVCADRHDLA